MSLDELSGFSATSKTKIEQAAELLETILNSEEFRQEVLAVSYGGQNQFVQNYRTLNDGTVLENLTNEQVYDAIMKGAEQYKKRAAVEDSVVNFDLNLYTPPWYKKWSVVGYTYPGQPDIYINWYYFNSNSLASVAANLAHEWCHKIGFDHDYNRTARRPYSVPYAVGNLVEKLGSGAGLPPK